MHEAAADVAQCRGLWIVSFGIFITPAFVWFVKVQGALNRYWEAKAPEAVATAPV